MTNTALLACDGCGQVADAEHVARRLKRLEWATRYRPVHIQALILGGIAPEIESEYLYAQENRYDGDAEDILRAAGITTEGKTNETVLTEFQRLGLMLAYVLECPLNDDVRPEHARGLLERHLPAILARIRRSLRPKRVVLFSVELAGVADSLRPSELNCSVWPSTGRPFLLTGKMSGEDVVAFRAALVGQGNG